MGTDPRHEVRLRFQAWQSRRTPPRAYALLLAEFYRQSPDVGCLAEWVAKSAERPLTAEEVEEARRAVDEYRRWRNQLGVDHTSRFPAEFIPDGQLPDGPAAYLWLALTAPELAASRFVAGEAWTHKSGWLLEIMNRLQP